jgi:hypothetical protein
MDARIILGLQTGHDGPNGNPRAGHDKERCGSRAPLPETTPGDARGEVVPCAWHRRGAARLAPGWPGSPLAPARSRAWGHAPVADRTRARARSGSFGVRGAAGSCRAAGRGWVRQDVPESALRWGLGAALGFARSGPMGDFRVHCGPPRWRAHGRRRGHVQLRCRLLGLERLERLERAPELGHRRAAVALGRSAPTTKVGAGSRPTSQTIACQILGLNPRTPDQGEAETAARVTTLREQLGLHAIGAREAPGGDRDPPREHGLRAWLPGATTNVAPERRPPTGASPSISAASRPANSSASSSGSTTYFCARRPCLSAFCAERALPSTVFGPRDFALLWRLASARVLLIGTAARGD